MKEAFIIFENPRWFNLVVQTESKNLISLIEDDISAEDWLARNNPEDWKKVCATAKGEPTIREIHFRMGSHLAKITIEV